MQVRCIRASYGHEAGDLVEVPGGATVSPLYFEPVQEAPAAAPAAAPAEPVKDGA